jgi:hypothetical protein
LPKYVKDRNSITSEQDIILTEKQKKSGPVAEPALHERAALRRILDVALEQERAANSAAENSDISLISCDNPAQYDWYLIGKQETLVPIFCTGTAGGIPEPVKPLSALLGDEATRWEQHSVRIIDGVLRRGESNILRRRRFFVDEKSGSILLGEGYDHEAVMVKCYFVEKPSLSSQPCRGRWYSF